MKHILITASMLLANTLSPTEKLAVLNAKVSNFQNISQANETIHFISKKNGSVYMGTSTKTGTFSLHLPKGDLYYIDWQSITGPFRIDSIAIPPNAGEGGITIQFDDTTIELEGVFFASGNAILNKKSFQALNMLAQGLQKNPKVKIEIAGHTDSQGDLESNLILSQQRSETVVNYLINQGIVSKRLLAKGYGPNQPVATNETSAGRAQNRRTEVRIRKE